MARRVVILALIATGVGLIVLGGQRWLNHRAASSVATTFVRALAEGDRDAALSQLTMAQRERVEATTGDENSPFWAPDPGLHFRVHHVEVDGDAARVRMWIDKEGFVLEPVFHMRLVETGRWKIERIENLQTDPRWIDVLHERERREGDALAEELAEALKDRPGVEISRAPGSERE